MRRTSAVSVAVLSVALLAGCFSGAQPGVAGTEPSTQEAPTFTLGQEQAMLKVHTYLAVGGFSRSALITQLTFAGIELADAEFAVDNMHILWNEQARKKAEQYVALVGFPRDMLIDQLMGDGFTREQAEYGARIVGS